MKNKSVNYKLDSLNLLFIAMLLITSCHNPQPNVNVDGEDKLQVKQTTYDVSQLSYQDTVYVPVYSDIYNESRLSSILLTATLSIRNTSLTDTTYISGIDYYNTHGKLVRSFTKNNIALAPMQSIDYVIDRKDDSGGVGANFLVMWAANSNTKPLIQAVMLGTSGNHGFSFVVNGVSTKID